MACPVDAYLHREALSGPEEECGDAGLILNCDSCTLFALVDALGHGPVAAGIAEQAIDYLQNLECHEQLSEILVGLHEELSTTRGAVAAICCYDRAHRTLDYCGIGNISLRIWGRISRRLVTQEGILGYMISTPLQNRIMLNKGDILIMHSDGITEHFDPDYYPGLVTGTAEEICRHLISHLGKANDDRSCLVVRFDDD